MRETRFSCRKSAIPRRDNFGSNHCRSSRRTLLRLGTHKLLWDLTAFAGASPHGSCLSRGRAGRLRWKLRALLVELSLRTTAMNCESGSGKYPLSARLDESFVLIRVS